MNIYHEKQFLNATNKEKIEAIYEICQNSKSGNDLSGIWLHIWQVREMMDVIQNEVPALVYFSFIEDWISNFDMFLHIIQTIMRIIRPKSLRVRSWSGLEIGLPKICINNNQYTLSPVLSPDCYRSILNVCSSSEGVFTGIWRRIHDVRELMFLLQSEKPHVADNKIVEKCLADLDVFFHQLQIITQIPKPQHLKLKNWNGSSIILPSFCTKGNDVLSILEFRQRKK